MSFCEILVLILTQKRLDSGSEEILIWLIECKVHRVLFRIPTRIAAADLFLLLAGSPTLAIVASADVPLALRSGTGRAPLDPFERELELERWYLPSASHRIVLYVKSGVSVCSL